jgi:hypothetical protein
MRRASSSLDWPLVLFAAAVAAHVAMLVSLFTGYLDPLFHDSDRYRRGIDFYSVYQAGDALLGGDSIYAWPNNADVPYSFPFRYLPFVAYAIAAPMNAIPAESAYWSWVVAIEAMLVLNATATYRLAHDRTWGLVAAAMWFAYAPLYLEVYMGQWSFLMATLIVLTAWLLIRRDSVAASIPWTASLLVKTNTALFAPLFLRLGTWRTVLAGAIIVFVLNVPYFAFRPDDTGEFWDENFGDYFSEPINRLGAFESGDLGLSGLVTAAWLWFDERAVATPAWFTGLITAAIIGVSLAATFVPRSKNIALMLSLWIAAYFILYGDVWEHHYVMLLPALALLVVREPRLRWLALGVFALIAIPTPYAILEATVGDQPADAIILAPELFWPAWARVVYHASKAIPVLVLWAALCWSLLGSRNDDLELPGREVVARGQ